MRISKQHYGLNIIQTTTLILLFLAGLNVANRYFYFCFIALAMFIILRKNITVDIQVIALLILSFSWLLFSTDTQTLSLTSILKPFLYPMAYVAGRSFFMDENQQSMNEKQKVIVPVFVILSLGPFMHYFINYVHNLGSLNRNTIDIWTGTVMSATNQAALGCMMLGVSLAFLFIDTSKYVKIFSLCCLTIIFLYNLVLSGRTLFVMAAVIILMCIIYYFIAVRSVGKKIKIISFILLFGIVLYFVYVYNIFGTKDFIVKSNMYLRILNKDNEHFYDSVRNQLKIGYMNNFRTGIFGGGHIKEIVGRYAHDLFLDTYDEAGIFALISVVYFIIRSAYVLIKYLLNKMVDLKIRILMISVYVALYSEFFIEPILQGVPWLFILFCFIHGIIENIYSDIKKRNNVLAHYVGED